MNLIDINLNKVISDGTITSEDVSFLLESIKSGKSIIIKGKTGTGKTSFARVLLQQLNSKVVVVKDANNEGTIEDTAFEYADVLNYGEIKPSTNKRIFLIPEIRNTDGLKILLDCLQKGETVIATAFVDAKNNLRINDSLDPDQEYINLVKSDRVIEVLVQFFPNSDRKRKITIC